MLSGTYYAHYYASIIGGSLVVVVNQQKRGDVVLEQRHMDSYNEDSCDHRLIQLHTSKCVHEYM